MSPKSKPPPKQKKKNAQSKPKQRPKFQNPTRHKLSVVAIEQVCSVNDPFCSAAIGAKYLDQSSVRSLAISSHGRVTVITNANGEACTAFCPSYYYVPFTNATTMTGGVATFTTAFSTATLPNATAVRLVSWGVTARNIVAPLSASGMVRIRGFTPHDFSTLAPGVDMMTYNCDAYDDIPTQYAKEIAIVGRRTDPTCKNWRAVGSINPSALPVTWVAPGFGCTLIAVTGAPVNTPVLDLEYIFNWEIMLEDSNTLSQMSTKAPVYNQAIETASNVVSSSSQNIFKAGVSAVGKYIERKAILALGTYLGGPAGAVAARAITVD